MSERQYAMVVLGATGFTGQFVAEEVGRISKDESKFKFAIAGRNKEKLEQSLKMARVNTGLNLKNVGIIVADVNDIGALIDMAKQTQVVINCVGPYRFYGEMVVSACIEGGANHLDISGEPQYLEQMQLSYSQKAYDKKVHIVGACGFDSVPADIGTIFLQSNFPGDVNSVDMVVSYDDSSKGKSSINFTTMECAVQGFAHRQELKEIRKKINSVPLPKPAYKAEQRGNLFWSSDAERWCIPNVASDRSVVMRTQRLNSKLVNMRPVQFSAYFGIKSIFTAIFGIIFGLLFGVMASFAITKKLLLKYPELMTFGVFSRVPPKREDLVDLKFCVTLTGHGWSDKLAEIEQQHGTPPNTTRVAKIIGPDPGYFGTAVIVTQCALTVLEEKSKLPQCGGVFTPGSAFFKTSIISRLQENGFQFTIK